MNDVQQKLDSALSDLENIMQTVDNIDDIDEFNIIYAKLKNYENNIIKINTTIKKILLIKDNLNIVINNYILKKINKKNLYKLQDCYSDSKNTISNKDSIKINYKNVTNDEKFNTYAFTKFAVINISEKNLDSIENAPIYYITETEQYCMKINNNLIMGNISNICTAKNKTKVNKCKNNNCSGSFYNKECKYFHNNESRNFTNYSWNHILNNKFGKYDLKNNILNLKKYDTENTRFIGSLDTLIEDLPFSSTNEKKLRSKQLIHDILLYMILSEYLR